MLVSRAERQRKKSLKKPNLVQLSVLFLGNFFNNEKSAINLAIFIDDL